MITFSLDLITVELHLGDEEKFEVAVEVVAR